MGLKLIRKLPSEKTEKGNYISKGIFECEICGKEVERKLSNAKKAKSCGCIKNKPLQSAETAGLKPIARLGQFKASDMKEAEHWTLVQCPKCNSLYAEITKRLADKKTCFCTRIENHNKRKPIRPHKIKENQYVELECPYCGEEIKIGEPVYATRGFMKSCESACVSCYETDEDVRDDLQKCYEISMSNWELESVSINEKLKRYAEAKSHFNWDVTNLASYKG